MMNADRRAVFLILRAMEKKDAYSNLEINAVLGREKTDSPAFVRELVYGVLRNQILLDHNIDRFLRKPSIKPAARILLRMGFYELSVMKAASYAAVNETVELAAAFIKGNQGFVNAVLRSFERSGSELVYPDESAPDYLSVRYSCAQWIVDLWTSAYGREKTEEILASCLTPLPLAIRVNRLRTTPAELTASLREKGFIVEPGRQPLGLIVSGQGLLDTPEFSSGLFRVQGEASQLAVDLLDPKPGELLIDLCASPGGKTCTAAELMNDEGRVLAFDIYKQRAGLVRKLADKQGLTIVETGEADATVKDPSLLGIADRVIADVPCSGLGVVRGKPEIKLREEHEDLKELTERQLLILSNAAGYVKIQDGLLLYTTCTLDPEENGLLVRRFLEGNETFEIVRELELTPMDGTDGFYICLLGKR